MTLSQGPQGSDFSTLAMESAALSQIRRLNRHADDLSQQLSGYLPYDALVRHEITRACSTAFEITQALSDGDPERACAIASGEPDPDGDVLGVAI